MDLRIEGAHEDALIKLMQRNGEKTAIAMARLLIRDAAKRAGVWPVTIQVEVQGQNEQEN